MLQAFVVFHETIKLNPSRKKYSVAEEFFLQKNTSRLEIRRLGFGKLLLLMFRRKNFYADKK